MQKEAYEIIIWASGPIRDWLLKQIENASALGFAVREIDNLLSLQTTYSELKIIFLSPTYGDELSPLLESVHPYFSLPPFWPLICCFKNVDTQELLRLRRLGVQDFLFGEENHKLNFLLRYYAACFQLEASHHIRQDYNYFKSIPAEKKYGLLKNLPIKRLTLTPIPKVEQQAPSQENGLWEEEFLYKALLATLLPSENEASTSGREAKNVISAEYLVWKAEELWFQRQSSHIYFYGCLLFNAKHQPFLLGKCDFDAPFSPSLSQAPLPPIGIGVFEFQTGLCKAANTAFQFYMSWFRREIANPDSVFDFSESYATHLSRLTFWGERNCNFITDALSALSPQNPSRSFYFYRVSHFQPYRFDFTYTQSPEECIVWVIQPLPSDILPWLPLRKILKTRNPLYTQLYESAPEAIFLVDDISLLILDCNPRAIKLFEAQSKEQLIGIWGSILHKLPEKFPNIREIAITVNSQRLHIAEVEYKTFEGNSFWGNLLSQLFFYQEKFPYLIVRVIDITRSYLLESAQLQLAQHLTLALEASNSVFWQWNIDQNIFYRSPQWLTLYEIESQNFKIDFGYLESRVHPEDKVIFLKNFSALLSGEKESLSFEHRIITEKGKCKWVAETVKALQTESLGHLTLICGILQDITERKKKEKEIAEHQVALLKAILQGEEQERMRLSQELHDGLGQQLQTILLRYALIAKKFKKAMFPGEEAIDYLTQLLNEAAEEARAISHNLSPLILEKHSLPEAIALFCQRLKNEQNPDIELSLHSFPAHIPPITNANLYRIVQELVQNAIKHAKAKKIHIYLDFYQNKILLLVEDDGIGLPENWSVKKESGIGLKNVKTRVELLGGTMSIHSSFRVGVAVLIEIPVPTP
jgi:PAS domain S-box-containing protein